MIISYGTNGEKKQYREVLASGGFKSLDEPVLHFGLGSHEKVTQVEIQWPDGSRTLLNKELASEHRYRITRKATARTA